MMREAGRKRAAILATGTEVVSGEVVNRNAPWISERLLDLGIEPATHLAVGDDMESMLAAMEWLSESHQIVIITGGLGPTSDDVTRDAIARFLSLPLEFNQEAFEDLKLRLEVRGVELGELHRHQCRFPKGARRITNQIGTAHGFAVERQDPDLCVIALPGPPGEISGMWGEVGVDVLGKYSQLRVSELHVWCLFGIPESKAAEITEKIAGGKGLTLGYRANNPLVRVKVWVPHEMAGAPILKELDQALGPWTVARGKEDPLDQWSRAVGALADPVQVVDEVSQGHLALLLLQRSEKHPLSGRFEFDLGSVPKSGEKRLTFRMELLGDAELKVSLGGKGGEANETLVPPPKVDLKSVRGRRWATQAALLWWVDRLRELKG